VAEDRASNYSQRVVQATQSANGRILLIGDLARRFGNHEVVKSLSLELEPGERLALVGPNGSGKSTVLRCIAGTLAPSAGTIDVGGHPAGSLEARRLLGASFSQERSFYLRLTGRANLLFFAQLRYGNKKGALREVEELEEELEIEEIAKERVDRCSSGMVQQLAMARAFLGKPSLILLDEPTRSLDKDARKRLWAAVDRRRQTGVVIASHLDEDIERCGTRIDFPT
jgi:ABC-2 type transport system ATP-binding protein